MILAAIVRPWNTQILEGGPHTHSTTRMTNEQTHNGRAFDRATGEGFVGACKGQYADALAKGHGVSLHHAESTGALGAVFMATLRVLAVRQSRLRGATDLTQYGKGRASSKAFLTHHVANISTAIQAADANAVLNAASARSLRQSLGLD